MGILQDLIRRPEWGAKYAPGPPLTLGQKTEMHVHHSVQKCPGPGHCAETLRSIEAQHERQWQQGIGYNLARCHDGFFEAAGLLRRGAHCPNHNTSSFGVVYIGDGREPLPAYFGYDLITDLDNLWDELSSWRGMRLYLYGHLDHKITNCPGDLLYAEVHNKFPSAHDLPTPPPAPTPQPTPDDGTYNLEAVMQNPVIAEGSSSQHAKIVKGLLSAHATEIAAFALGGFDQIGPWCQNRDFGEKSAAILREWQRATGVLVPDGICGPKTWAWLCGLPVG